MRRLSAAALALSCAAAASGAAQAPAAPRAGRVLPAVCAHPAERIEWGERVLFATLGNADSAGVQLPVSFRQLMLDDVTARLRARLAPRSESGAPVPPAGQGLPAGDSLYTARVLMTRIGFTLYGSGVVRDVRADTMTSDTFGASPGDSLFDAHAREAIEASAAEGVIGPYSDRGTADSARLVLQVTSQRPPPIDTTAAAWPLFRMEVPLEREPAPLKGPRVQYPEGARRGGFQATVIMRFVVDEFGRPVPSTIEPVRKPGDIPADLEPIYKEFVVAVRRGIERATYRPAEMLGCRVRQLALQPFEFGFR
ncbi:MAG TPA: hypothetical protein VKA84_27810 [Gemmatimonadaceae bacterium]|nr:hypothetical protein [Gemmatimonadaceae bacterium]